MSGRIREKELAVFSYLVRLAEAVSDKMVDEKEYHLLSFRKRQVNEHFCKEYKILYQKNALSFSYFDQTWILYKYNIEVWKNNCFARSFFCDKIDATLWQAIDAQRNTPILKGKKCNI